jgi:hypothetical protein
MTPKYSDELNYRRDSRTKKDFIKDIKSSTKKEAFLMRLFQREMKARGHKVTYKSYGVDNTGKFVEEASCAPDYKVTIDGRTGLLEIKNSPVSHKWTFKIHNLNKYVEQKAGILIFWGTDNLKGNHKALDKKNTRFGIISPKLIIKMIKDHKPYREKMFGNKMCIQVKDKDFEKYVQSIERLSL